MFDELFHGPELNELLKKWDNVILEIDEDEEGYSDDGEKGLVEDAKEEGYVSEDDA